MNRLTIPTLLIFITIAFIRCSTCNCIDSDINFNFSGFAITDLTAIKIKKFNRGTGFSQILDSAYFQAEIDYRLQPEGDTFYFASRSGDIVVSKEWDWQIELPAAGHAFRITDIDVAQTRNDCSGKSICINPVRSMRIDGALLQGPIIIPTGFMLHK